MRLVSLKATPMVPWFDDQLLFNEVGIFNMDEQGVFVVAKYYGDKEWVDELDPQVILDSHAATPTNPANTKITLYAFRARFTLAEKVAIEDAAVSDSMVRAVLKDFDSATYIDLSRQDVRDGVNVFVIKDLITEPRAHEILSPERAEEILTQPVTESEVPWFLSR